MMSGMLVNMERGRWKFFVIAAIAFAAAAALLYGQTLNDEFHFDDAKQIVDNDDVKSFRLSSLARYARAITMLTYALNMKWSGPAPWSWHLASMALFAMLGLAVTGALIFLTPPGSSAKKAAALALSLMFVAHPMATQAVAYISQRSEILCGLFSVCALCAYIAARREGSKMRPAWYALALAATACAVRSKEAAAVLPLVFVAAEIFLLPDSKDFLRRALSVAGAAVATIAVLPLPLWRLATEKVDAAGVLMDVSAVKPMSHATFFLSGQEAIWRYLRLIFLPYGQSIDHDVPPSQGLSDPFTLAALIGILAIVGLIILFAGRRPLVSFGLAWFLLFMAPVTTFFPLDDLVAEHRALTPMIGLVFAGFGLLQSAKKPAPWIGAIVVLAIICGAITMARVPVWDSELTLWSDAANKSPGKARPFNNLGIAQVRAKRIDGAGDSFARAIALDPGYREPYENLGNCCVIQTNWECAIDAFNRAIELGYDRGTALNLMKVMWRTGQKERMEAWLQALPDKRRKELLDAAGRDPFFDVPAGT